MAEALPKATIDDTQPVRTAELREHQVFTTADPEQATPDVVLGSASIDEHDRQHRSTLRVGINTEEGDPIGTLNLVQRPNSTWVNNVRIEGTDSNGESVRGRRYGVATYLGLIAHLDTFGRQLISDPGGLSNDSLRVWESLERRGVAERLPDAQDQHGNPTFRSK